MSKSQTERAEYSYKATEYEDGTPWILCEPVRGQLSVAGNGFFGFDLPDGTTFDEANKIAKFLDENIKALAYTSFR